MIRKVFECVDKNMENDHDFEMETLHRTIQYHYLHRIREFSTFPTQTFMYPPENLINGSIVEKWLL